MDAQSHPDFIFIEPNKPGNRILIENIRELIGKLSTTTHYGVHRGRNNSTGAPAHYRRGE